MPDLIEQIRTRLLPKRGVFALKEEILVTLGAQHAYYLLADALFDDRTRVGLEEPGHPHARNSFAMRNPKWVEVAVDDEGLVVDALPAADYLFVTPSHQSPTTATLSLERRQWLLRKAELQDFVIIEDDYEAENLYEGKPMPALKSLDKTGRVIYVGSVSKSLSPALRLGYIVAPRALIKELRVIRHAMVRHPSAFLQHAYALFLSLGHHESHARRVNHAMQERLALAAQALREHLPDFEFTLPQGGASIWVQAPSWVDAGELSLMARSHGVLIEAGDVFFAQAAVPVPFLQAAAVVHRGGADSGRHPRPRLGGGGTGAGAWRKARVERAQALRQARSKFDQARPRSAPRRSRISPAAAPCRPRGSRRSTGTRWRSSPWRCRPWRR